MVAWGPRAEGSRNQTTKSGSGGAFAAYNAGFALELWGQRGAWNSFASLKRYMKRDQEAILTVSRAIMGQRGPPPSMVRQTPPSADIRIECGDIIEELEGDAEVAPEVEDLPDGAFRWS